jgi:hypothetical protein
MGVMKNRTVLLIAIFAAVAAIGGIAAMLAGRDSVNAILQDAGHWLDYFVHVHYDY